MQSYAMKEASGNKKRETSKCPICEGQHDIEDCTTILEQAGEKEVRPFTRNVT